LLHTRLLARLDILLLDSQLVRQVMQRLLLMSLGTLVMLTHTLPKPPPLR
jgi:hypothetical protein